MIIGIDGNVGNILNRSEGVQQYTFEILWSFYRINETDQNKIEFVIYLSSHPVSDLPKENINWKYKVIPGKHLWVLTKLMPELIWGKGLDVFFSPSHYLPIFASIPQVCTIHDLGYLVFTGQFRKYDFWQLKYWTAISIIISKRIISISESTSKDIVRHYKIASKKITTVLHGYSKSRFNDKVSLNLVRQVKRKYKISKNYILFLSLLKPSKNLEGIIQAFKNIARNAKYNDYILVIAGKKGWLYDAIFEQVKRYKLTKRVIFTGFVDEEDKPALMSGAKLLIAPSFWEGFGMHILEALACGTPVVVSNIASIPEVVEKAGIYVDPYNILSIQRGIEKILMMNSSEYQNQINESLAQAQKFSWEKAGRETLAAIISTVKLK